MAAPGVADPTLTFILNGSLALAAAPNVGPVPVADVGRGTARVQMLAYPPTGSAVTETELGKATLDAHQREHVAMGFVGGTVCCLVEGRNDF